MCRESDPESMMRSAVRSAFNSLAENSLILVPLAALLLYISSYHLTAWLLCIGFYGFCVRDGSVIPAALVLLCFLIPCSETDPKMRQGRVVEVHANYAVVTASGSSMLVYTKALPLYDSVIAFDGIPERMQDGKGFYRFPFARSCALKGITYSVSPDSIQELRPGRSLRSLLMKRAASFEPEVRDYLLEVLFRISSADNLFRGLFRDRGFSLAGVTACIDRLLQYCCYERKRRGCRIVVTCALALLFHFPYVLLVRLIRYGLELCGMQGKAKSGFAFLISLRLCPFAVFSASFLFPLVFAFSAAGKQSMEQRLFFSMHASSVLFHSVNPAEILLFRWILPLSGFCWICAFLQAVTGIPLHGMVLFIDRIHAWTDFFTVPGTMLGAGLPFYLLSQLSLKKGTRNTLRLRLALFLLFQYFGMFHPFMELTFINVGQGDSMLVRSPMRTGDILIDTGKPSQKNNVISFLEAKGIRRLHTLIITHADNDHSGNQEAVTDTFHPSEIITEHIPVSETGMIRILDLNDIESEDENESSVVSAFALNGLDILLMGDSSADTEERILHRFHGIHADILKLSHHGSKTGSSERFLNAVRPKLAVISSGAYRIYHHPSPEVITRLSDRRIPYLDTKEEGDITILCLPGLNLLLTASGKIAIIRL